MLSLLTALTVAHAAEEPQYRHLKLGDGRDFYAQIQQTEAAGFKVLVPQGEMRVSFDNLENMSPATASDYAGQNDWVVYLVAPQERLSGLVASFKAIPHLTVATVDDPSPLGVSGAVASQLAACDTNIDCMADATKGAQRWFWIVSATAEGTKMSLRARTNHGVSVRNPVLGSVVDPADLANAIYKTLDLTTKSTITGPSEKPMQEILRKRQEVVQRSYVPLPGYPSMKRGDTAGFAMALGTAVPLTAGWVYVVGRNTESAPAMIGLSAVGFYAISVATSQAFGMRGLSTKSTSLMVEPTAHQGAAVRVTVVR